MTYKENVGQLKQLAEGRWTEILAELGGLDRDLLDGRKHPCPKCGGKDRFRLINEKAGALFCNQCFSEENGDGVAALQWLNGWSFPETLQRLAEKLGINGSGSSASKAIAVTSPKPTPQQHREVACYEYRDESGDLLYQKVRYEPKSFRQRTPKPGGGWVNSLQGVRRVLYRLPELLEAASDQTVFVVEGEKDADRLHRLGLIVTCNFDGAGKWRDDYTKTLAGRHIVILTDNDKEGQAHGEMVASKLKDKAASVRVIELPGLPEKGDVSDWLDAGGTVEELAEIVSQTKLWEPGSSDRPKPFPLDALPEVARRYVKEAADALMCDPGFVAPPLLAVLAAAIGDACVVQLKRTWREPPILWVAVIAPSASLKTPAMTLALDPMQPMNREGFRDYDDAMLEYEQEALVYEGDLSDWKKTGRKKGEPAPPKPQPPECKRYIISDITLEALADRLARNPHGLLVAVDELAGWIGSLDAYRSGTNKDEAGWLSLHSGAPLTVDRKTGRPTLYVERPVVSIVGGIQPGVFAELFGAGKEGKRKSESGMTQRILLSRPPLKPKVWTERDINDATKEAMFSKVRDLVDLSPEVTILDERIPHVIKLSPEAKEVWTRFYNEHAQEIHTSTGAIRAHWGKLEAYAPRLALILHLTEFANNDYIPGTIHAPTMRSAIRLARWFGAEAQRIYANVLGVEGEVNTEQRDLIAWIAERGGRTTVRDMKRGLRLYRNGDKAEQALSKLASQGLGFWEVDSHSGNKGKPRSVFVLGDFGAGDINSLNLEENRFMSPCRQSQKAKSQNASPQKGGLLI